MGRECTAAESILNIARLRRLIGEDWISSHSHVLGDSEHVFTQWLRMTNELSQKDLVKSDAHLRLARLAAVVRNLEDEGISGAAVKIRGLQVDDNDQFLSLVHELVTADGYRRDGCSVAFVAENSLRTPDLLVDGVELECKRKVADTSRDTARHDSYALLERKLRRFLDSSRGPEGLVLEANFLTEPSRDHIDEILNAVRLDRAESKSYVTTDGNCHFTITRGNYDGPSLSLPVIDPNEFDVMRTSGVIMEEMNGLQRLGKVLSVGFECEVVQDLIRAVQATLESAAGQFSGDVPAVVELDMTATAYAYNAKMVPHMDRMLESFFRRNTRVSAVNFVQDIFVAEEAHSILSRRTDTVSNPLARHALPPKFPFRQ